MTFDPDQPRDPDGKWGDGMPSVISSVTFSLGGQQATMESKPGNRVTLKVGGAEVTGDRETLTAGLLAALGSGEDSHDITDEKGVNQLGLDFGEYVEDGNTPAELHFVGQGVSVGLSAADLKTLEANTRRAQVAQRLDLPSGPVDVFLGDKTFGLRTRIQGSEPVTYELDPKDFKKLSDAENVVHEGFDEMGAYGPEGQLVNELLIKTGQGTWSVARDVPYSESDPSAVVDITIGPIDRDDFFITHSTASGDPWFGAIADLEDAAAEEGFYPHRAGGTLMTARNARRGPRGGVMHRALGYVDRAALRDGAPLRVIMASEGRMADGIDLRMSGAQLDRYRGNPVLGYGHSYYGRENLPIGRVVPESLAVEGTKLVGDLDFDQEDPFAREVERKMRAGYLNAVSIGFEVKEWENEADSYWRGGVATGWEQTELSVVPVPMDASALVTAGRGRSPADPDLIAAARGCNPAEFDQLLDRLRGLREALTGDLPTLLNPEPPAGVPQDSARGLLDAFTITKESHA